MPKQRTKGVISNKKITAFFTTKNQIQDCLEQKEQNEKNICDASKCIEDKKYLKDVLEKSVQKYNNVKKALEMCHHFVEQKKHKIKVLQKQLHKPEESQGDSDQRILFSTFTDIYTKNGLAELRSIGGEKEADSTFILTGMRQLYKNDMHRLKKKSVTGRSRTSTQKEAMTPQKLSALKGIFMERLNALDGLDDDNRTKRKHRLNLHIKAAIQNLTIPKKMKLDQINANINSNQKKN